MNASPQSLAAAAAADPWGLAEKILRLQSEAYRAWRAGDRRAAERQEAEVDLIRAALGTEFASRRGLLWRRSLHGLHPGGRHAAVLTAIYDARLDHPEYLKVPGRGGRVVAVVAHNYDKCGEIDPFVASRSGDLERIDDFPSWHVPGETVLLVLTLRRPQQHFPPAWYV